MPCRLDRLPLDPTCTVAKLRETISLRSGWTNFELRAKDAEREIGFTLYDADIVKDAVQTGEGEEIWWRCPDALTHVDISDHCMGCV